MKGSTFFRNRILTKFKYVDQKLSGHDYVMGNQFTVVDGYLFTMLVWADRHEDRHSSLPTLVAYKARVARVRM